MTHSDVLSLDRDDIDALDKRHRTALINSLSGFKSAHLVGSADANGRSNLSLVSSVFHVGAAPPLLGMLIRPHTVPRHTLENLQASGHYTLNGISRQLVDQAHAASARFPREVSEFAATGLTEYRTPGLSAPYVKESPLQIGLQLVEQHTLAANGCVLVVGEIIELALARDTRAEDGHIDLTALDLVTIAGLDEYLVTDSLGRKPYAKAPS